MPENAPFAASRFYVQAGDRLVHVRQAGTGPAVVMLHDSPRSSRLHLPTMAALADRYTVFALDTAGYGQSDPIGLPNPRIEDFATALGEALAALGMEKAPLYATHTSAKIALAYAVRCPVMPRLILDGLSMPEVLAEESFIATYMRPFRPDASGGYLASEWGRVRDMLRWFPWFATNPAQRMAIPAPDAAWMADYAIDLFSAGEHYSDAYAAAMRYDPMPDLARVAAPTIVAARQDDVLHGYLPRAAESGNPQVTTQSLPADREAWLDWLAQAFAVERLAAPASPAQSGARRYTHHAQGQLHWTVSGTGEATPWVILSAPTTLHAHGWAAAIHGPCLVPDLPGFGESDPATDILEALEAGLREMGLNEVQVLGLGVASPLAAALAKNIGAKRLVVDGLPPLDPEAAARFGEGLCPPISFDPLAGSHNHQIWHILRDGEAQWPWHDASPAAIRQLPPLLEADGLHQALTGVLKQPLHWGDAANAALAMGKQVWADLALPVLAFTHADPAYADAPQLAALCGARLAPRPDTLAQAAALLETV
jgi:hypothetical protein